MKESMIGESPCILLTVTLSVLLFSVIFDYYVHTYYNNITSMSIIKYIILRRARSA